MQNSGREWRTKRTKLDFGVLPSQPGQRACPVHRSAPFNESFRGKSLSLQTNILGSLSQLSLIPLEVTWAPDGAGWRLLYPSLGILPLPLAELLAPCST